jgi:hypothetical protein
MTDFALSERMFRDRRPLLGGAFALSNIRILEEIPRTVVLLHPAAFTSAI